MSCGQIALERAEIKVENYFASEIKPHALKVTQDNYPNTIQLGDVTKISYSDGKLTTSKGEFNVGDIDLLIGGSPCQNFSIACIGEKRQGLKGEKSILFYEYLRLLEEVKPKWFLLENVGSMKKVDSDAISEYLQIEPIQINSELVSGQLRNRLYWTNIPNIGELEDKGILFQDILTEGYTNRKKSRTLTESMSRPNIVPHKMFHRYVSTGFTSLIFKNEDHYLKCKEHHREHFKGKSALEIDSHIEENQIDVSVYDGVRYANKTELERLQNVPEGYTRSVTRNEAASLLGDGWTVDVIAHIFKGLKQAI